MGANESSAIQVAFNRPNSFYFAGEQISGNISYQNTHERLVVDEVFLEFVGELGYASNDTRYHTENRDSSLPEPYTVYQRVQFVNVHLPLIQPPNEQHENILSQGQNSWPFKLTLPRNLPPSLVPSETSHPYVKYYVRIIICKPWYKPNTKQVYPLKIYPRVTLLHINDSQQPVPFSYFNRKQVHLDGRLLQGGFVPNKKLSIQINLQNPKKCVIKRIEIILIRHLQVDQNRHEENIIRANLPGLREFNGTEFRRTFHLRLTSTLMLPTYKFMAQFNRQTYPVIIKYKLALRVKSNGMLTDFEVKMPVIIGTELTPDPEEQQQTDTFAETLVARASISDYDDPPPSYETLLLNAM